MKSNRFWLLALGSTAAVCLLCAAILPRLYSPGTVAQIYQNGVLLRTEPLSKTAEFTVSAPNGGWNTIEIRQGQICVSHATCPDQVCVRQGWTNSPATPIVCLPNSLVIKIKGGESDLDATTG